MVVKLISIWHRDRMRRWQDAAISLEHALVQIDLVQLDINIKLAERCHLFEIKKNIEFVTCNESCVITYRSADTPHSANISTGFKL